MIFDLSTDERACGMAALDEAITTLREGLEAKLAAGEDDDQDFAGLIDEMATLRAKLAAEDIGLEAA